ncbi:MAG: squalene/phytoene synthase family protein [Acidobacteriota bacterium]
MADLQDLLVKTSRTFALSIPRLPEPTRGAVTIAYLLFRIADTFEDAATWPRAQRVAALASLEGLLDDPDAARAAAEALAATWVEAVPIDHAGYQELLRETPAVLEAYFALPEATRACVRHHTVRTAEGMAGFVVRTDDDGELQLRDLDDLRHYCYIVAGIVGELLTDLFLLHHDNLSAVAAPLEARARAFGEGLQLVNILRDAAFDATEGRSYLPASVTRDQLFALARRDLDRATEYVHTLQDAGGPSGVVAFTALPVLLAYATLDRVEADGPGAKVDRATVVRLSTALDADLEATRPVIRRAPSA